LEGCFKTTRGIGGEDEEALGVGEESGREGGSHTVVWRKMNGRVYHCTHTILVRDEKLRKRSKVAFRRDGGRHTVLLTTISGADDFTSCTIPTRDDELLTSI